MSTHKRKFDKTMKKRASRARRLRAGKGDHSFGNAYALSLKKQRLNG